MTDDLQKEHLDLLLQASALLNSTLSLDGVLAYLLREAVKIVGAQHGAILLQEDGDFVPKAMIPERTDFPYSRTIVSQVLEEQATVCLLDAADDATYDPLSSIKSGNLRSVICAPLLWKGEARGVIYLDHRVSQGLFQEEQKRLIEALSQQWAVALENAALHEEREFLHEVALQKASNELAETQAQLFTAHELTSLVVQTVRGPLQEIASVIAPGDLQRTVSKLQHTMDLFARFVQPDRERWPIFLLNETVEHALALGLTGDAELTAELQDAPVKGDPSCLGRVFLNLLSNSEDAVSDVSGEQKIKVRTHTKEGRALLEIEDTGCGMSEEIKSRMFEPFFSTRGVEYRSGLGLAVAQQALNMHGADIEVESTPGRGTKIVISFPPV
ncbi:MAG: ATP-binding protein [Vulcanimicrobiota bacterium]